MTEVGQEFVITHRFAAPRAMLWRAWTEPALFANWFGPKGFRAKVAAFDLRAGGLLHSCLTSPEGQEMWAKFVYRDVVAPSRLVWEHSFSDKDGNITRHPGHVDWPLKILSTLTLNEAGDQTDLLLHWTPLEASEVERKTFADGLQSMHQGWSGTFEQLTAFLSTIAD